MRLVVYEGLTRSPTPIFNEKVLAGLGREVQSTGLLAADAVEKALAALRRFRALCDRMEVTQLWAIATAACRDAKNGKAFIAEAERICGNQIDVLSGKREAELSALGVVSGFHQPDGIVGDLGGGSLELTELHGHRIKPGMTLPLGGLALQDISSNRSRRPRRSSEGTRADARCSKRGEGRTFYAIGGTWRALARLHMWQTGYPLHVMHGYVIPAKEAFDFSSLVHRVNPETLSQIEVVTDARRPLLAYAALVLEISCASRGRRRSSSLRSACAKGLLYSMLDAKEREQDALIAAASELNVLRSRSPAHGAGADCLDRPFHGVLRSRRDARKSAGCATPPASSPISAGARIRTIAASSRSTSSPTRPSSPSIIPAAPSSRLRCSSAMSGWSTKNFRRGCASSPRRACSTARACSAPRCASPISSRPRPPACCRRPDGGRARKTGAALRQRLEGARRRAGVRAAAPARAPDRPRAGDANALERLRQTLPMTIEQSDGGPSVCGEKNGVLDPARCHVCCHAAVELARQSNLVMGLSFRHPGLSQRCNRRHHRGPGMGIAAFLAAGVNELPKFSAPWRNSGAVQLVRPSE